MQFIDLSSQQYRIREKLREKMETVLNHGCYIMGPEIEQLEKKLSEFVEVKHAIGCASGTDALLMALLAKGVKPGDGIITTPFTFISTAEVIRLIGGIPIFIDIDPVTFNIDPNKIESFLTQLDSEDRGKVLLPRTGDARLFVKGIIAVDLFGLPADYNRLNAIAERYGLFVVEDAAQSFGASIEGKKAGALAEQGCTSFFPAKPLGCYGDGGACFTDNDEIAEILNSIKIHGKGGDKYDNVRVGINGRLDTLQAAILLVKFDIFPEEIELRNKVAFRYNDLLSDIDSLTLPQVPSGYKSVWAQYSILARDEEHRARLQDGLKAEGIPTAIYYPRPLHLQKAFADLHYQKGDFPVSEDYASRILSLPMHPYLSEKDQYKIKRAVKAIPVG